MRQTKKAQQTLTIDRLSHEGRGIGQLDNGKTVFVPFALPGETVTIQPQRQRTKWVEANLVSIDQPASQRIEPQCPFFTYCGACQLQHMTTDAQLTLKANNLADQLTHFGHGLMPDQWIEPLQSPSVWGYRYKARLSVRYVAKKQRVLVGFREVGGRFVADIDHCKILHPAIGQYIDQLSSLIEQLDAYDQIPQIEVAIDGRDQVALIIRHMVPLTQADQDHLQLFAEQTGFWLYSQAAGPESVQPLFPENLDTAPLSYSLNSLKLSFSPLDFTQINHHLNLKMVPKALASLAIQPEDRVIDLFCGLGNFSLPMAQQAGHVLGIEADQTMVQRATMNAQQNHLTNTTFMMRDLFSAFDWVQPCDKLLLDPPRAGAKEVCEQIEKLGPERIVYISCNPATLARDAGILVHEKGYHFESAGVMDMFPHTKHVESIAVFTKDTLDRVPTDLGSDHVR